MYKKIICAKKTERLTLNQPLEFGRLIRTLVGGRYINDGAYVKEYGLLNTHKDGILTNCLQYIIHYHFCH